MSCQFSIVITCYNQREFIRDAVNSALCLQNADREIIVVDDGSTDGSREMLAEYGNAIRFIPLETNRWKGAARNCGASVATGDYLLFLDGDDAFLPWALDACQRVVQTKRPKLILCSLSWFKGALPPTPPPPREIRIVEYNDFMQKDLPFGVSASSLVIERGVFEAVQGWATERFVMQDHDLVMRLGDVGPTVLMLSPPTTWHRAHAGQTVNYIPPFIEVLHQLITKERSGRYPGGRTRRLERWALLGCLVYFWSKQALKARLYWSTLKLLARAWPHILTAAIHRTAAIVKGRRTCEILEVREAQRPQCWLESSHHQPFEEMRDRSIGRLIFRLSPTLSEERRTAARAAVNYFTRVFETILSGAALVVLSHVFLLISALIKLESPGSVIFCQPRVGWRGRRFQMYKFRTLYDPKYRPRPQVPPPRTVEEAKYRRDFCCEECARPTDDCTCITRVGRILRKTNLDELPQLWNVFRGDMTFVGPRPTLQYQVDQYTPRQRGRLNAKPGITGLAQVSGRNALTWDEKIELDLWYVENRHPWLDCKILFRTLASRGN